jgi:hypothetical protein
MEKVEAKSAAKAIYLQSAAMAGMDVSPFSPERLADIVEEGFDKVEVGRRPSAVASVLRLIAATLEVAESQGERSLQETHVHEAKESVCPIYPFGGAPAARSKSSAKARSKARPA